MLINSNEFIEKLKAENLVIVSAEMLSNMVSSFQNTAHEVLKADALKILGVSKTTFETLEKSDQTLIIRTKNGGRGVKSKYLRSSIIAELQRLKNK